MEKQGRSRSKDPDQESLRTHKDEWNSETSKLIGKLISFKRGLNGKGDKSSGLPPGHITEPIPTPVASYLDEIINSSNLVIDHARSIINEQKDYASTRTHTHAHASKEEDIIRLANLLGEASLSKEASWWGSRFLSRIKFLFADSELREKKLSLMRALVALLSDLKDFEEILTSKKNSIGKVISIFNSFLFSFEHSYLNNFLAYSTLTKEKLEDLVIEEKELKLVEKPQPKEKKTKKEEKPTEVIAPIVETVFSISQIVDDFQFLEFVLNLLIKDSADAALKKELEGFVQLFNLARVSDESSVEEETIKRYKTLLNKANAYFKTNAKSFQDLEIPDEVLKKSASAISNLLDRVSLTFQRGMVPFLKKEILKEITILKENISSTLDEIEKVESNYLSIDQENLKMIDSIKSIIAKMLDLGNKYAQETEVKSRDDKFHLTDFKIEHLSVLKQQLKKLENYEKISRNK
jgi:hypothetical protein